MVLDVGNGIVEVNGVLNMWERRRYCFTQLKQSVEWSWSRRQSQKFQSQLMGIQKGAGYWSRVSGL